MVLLPVKAGAYMRLQKQKPDFPLKNPAFVLWQTTSLLAAGAFHLGSS
jgi:hypothetical protein